MVSGVTFMFELCEDGVGILFKSCLIVEGFIQADVWEELYVHSGARESKKG